jgi:hypothetical protein
LWTKRVPGTTTFVSALTDEKRPVELNQLSRLLGSAIPDQPLSG